MSEAEEMELFKKEFYEDLSKITNHRTVSNAAVNISGEAFKAMKDDPQYREKVLSLIQRDWGDSYAPRNCSVLITVGATLNEYRADSWPVGYDSEFDMRSQNSFYKRTSEKKDRQKELLEEYLENRAQAKKQQLEMLNKKIAKMELERSRQTQSWNSERQMAKASNAYDANIMMEAELVKNITKGENNGKDKVQEYYEKLCKKFPEITFNTGSSLMSGNENKVVINLSSECLKKMANDPEFAKKVEFNLTGAVPGQNRMFAQAKADNAVIHGVTTVIDADGNASVTCGGMTRTSGSKQNSTILNAEKKQKERLLKKREERKISEEKAAKRRAEKKAQLEKLTEDETFTISATGTDVKSVTQNLLVAVSGTSAPTGASFDIKA